MAKVAPMVFLLWTLTLSMGFLLAVSMVSADHYSEKPPAAAKELLEEVKVEGLLEPDHRGYYGGYGGGRRYGGYGGYGSRRRYGGRRGYGGWGGYGGRRGYGGWKHGRHCCHSEHGHCYQLC